MRQASWNGLPEKTSDEFKAFLLSYSPSMQTDLAFGDALTGDYPVLAVLRREYGRNAPTMWLIPQLVDLSEFSGSKNKLEGHALESTAALIADEYYYLKISELALFFRWLKLGRYGSFYGAVDPMFIMASLRSFVRERNSELERMEYEVRRVERAAAAADAVTYEEYLRMKENGTLPRRDSR